MIFLSKVLLLTLSKRNPNDYEYDDGSETTTAQFFCAVTGNKTS
jgi:hypothetical protein